MVFAQSEIDRIKALYVYNFLLFVDWPEKVTQESQHIRIGVMGDPALFELLKAMELKRVKGKELVIRQMDDHNGLLGSLHALFIGSRLRHAGPRILHEVKDQPVLTMSDMEGFTEMGGMVCFCPTFDTQARRQDSPKRFKVNLKAVEDAGLKIRSQLLRLSDIVNDPGVQQPDNP